MAKKKSTTKKTDETYEDIVDDTMIEVSEKLEETPEKVEVKTELEDEKFVEAKLEKAEIKEQEIPLEQYCAGLNQEGIDKFAYERLNSKIAEKLLPVGPHTRTEWETIYLRIRNN